MHNESVYNHPVVNSINGWRLGGSGSSSRDLGPLEVKHEPEGAAEEAYEIKVPVLDERLVPLGQLVEEPKLLHVIETKK